MAATRPKPSDDFEEEEPGELADTIEDAADDVRLATGELRDVIHDLRKAIAVLAQVLAAGRGPDRG